MSHAPNTSRGTSLAAILLLLLPHRINAFQYALTNPVQCGDLSVTWSGGSEPYHVVIIPVANATTYAHILNVTLPTGATSPYSIALTEPSGMTFIGVMWDSAGGYEATGVTDVLTVGSSSNTSCLTAGADAQADFLFSISSDPPAQCSSLDITWDSDYTPPAYITGYIPGGSVFDIDYIAGAGTTSASWTVDVASGTGLIIAMSDAGTYGTGGSTELMTIGTSSQSGCLNADSPASIAASSSTSASSSTNSASTSASSATTSGTSTTTTKTSAVASGASAASSASSTSSIAPVGGSGGSSNSTGDGSSGAASTTELSSSPPIGGIVGGVVGGLAFLALLAILLFFCRRRRRRRGGARVARDPIQSKEKTNVFGAYGARRAGKRNGRGNQVDLLGRGEKGDDAGQIGSGGLDGGHGVPSGEDGENAGLFEPSPYMGGAAPAAGGLGAGAIATGAHRAEPPLKTENDATPTGTNRSSIAPSSPAVGSDTTRMASDTAPQPTTAFRAAGGAVDPGATSSSTGAVGSIAGAATGSRDSQGRSSMDDANHTWLASQGGGGVTSPNRYSRSSEDEMDADAIPSARLAGSPRRSNGESSPLMPPGGGGTTLAIPPGRSNSTRKQPLRVSNPGPTSPPGSLNRGNGNNTTTGMGTGTRYVMHEDGGSVSAGGGGMSDHGAEDVVELPPAYPGPQARRNE